MVSIYAPVKPNLNICRSQRQLLIPAMIPTYCVHSTRVFLQLVVPIRVWNEMSWITSNIPSATAIATFRTVSNTSVPGKLQHLLWSTCPQLCPWWVNGYRLVNILKANIWAAVCQSISGCLVLTPTVFLILTHPPIYQKPMRNIKTRKTHGFLRTSPFALELT
jgi:hypothetical protein